MIELSKEQRAELEELDRSRQLDLLTGKRVMALLHLDRNSTARMTVHQVSRALFVSEQTIYHWIRLFNNGDDSGNAIKGLFIKHSSGRESALTPDQEAMVIEYFRCNVTMQVQRVIEFIGERFGRKYSRSGAIKLMHRLGFSFKKPKLIPHCASIAEQQEFINCYEEMRDNLPEDEVILFGDGVHPTHQARPAGGWIFKGDEIAIKANSGRQRIDVLGGINLKDGRVHIVADATINAESVIKIMKNLESQYSDKRVIHYIVDNARYFHSKMVRDWQKQTNSRVKLHFLPPYSPHLNPIERLWGVMHKNITHNRYYEKFNDFSKAILHFLRTTIHQNWSNFSNSITDNFRIITHDNFKLI